MAGIAASTKVVVTTVGPYAKYGMPLVNMHAEGTTPTDRPVRCFVRSAGRRRRRRSPQWCWSHACGFDSIRPTWCTLTAERAAADGQGASWARPRQLRASTAWWIQRRHDRPMRTQAIESAANASDRKIVADPTAQVPDRGAEPRAAGRSAPRPAHRSTSQGRGRRLARAPDDRRALTGLSSAAPSTPDRCGAAMPASAMLTGRLPLSGGHDFGTRQGPRQAGAFTGPAGVAGGCFVQAHATLSRPVFLPGARARASSAERRFRMEVESTTTTGRAIARRSPRRRTPAIRARRSCSVSPRCARLSTPCPTARAC